MVDRSQYASISGSVDSGVPFDIFVFRNLIEMPTRIAEYYSEEILDWSEYIEAFRDESDLINERLSDVIRRNSISNIAQKVEVYQDALDRMADIFETIEDEFNIQEQAIKDGEAFIEDTRVNPEIERRQELLRERMKEAEKEFIDVKFGCYQFLSDLLS
jgi:DNA-binding phage protein